MQRFSKLHSFLKFCPTCDVYSRETLLDESFYCKNCNGQWHFDTIIEEYENLLN